VQDFAAFARGAAVLATGQLGWQPAAFWQATVAELRLALEGRFGPGAPPPLAGPELARLQERWPDAG
jgi:hypothetical protein